MKEISPAPAILYGIHGDISAQNITIDEELRPRFNVVSYGREYEVALPVHGVQRAGLVECKH